MQPFCCRVRVVTNPGQSLISDILGVSPWQVKTSNSRCFGGNSLWSCHAQSGWTDHIRHAALDTLQVVRVMMSHVTFRSYPSSWLFLDLGAPGCLFLLQAFSGSKFTDEPCGQFSDHMKIGQGIMTTRWLNQRLGWAHFDTELGSAGSGFVACVFWTLSPCHQLFLCTTRSTCYA